MEKQKLYFGATFREGLVYAGRNFFPVLGCILLYVLTIWIPYLNIGTTIAIVLLPVQISKGEPINPFQIFDARYRKYMGEYFVLAGIMFAALVVSLFFFVLPFIIMAIAWGLSLLLFGRKTEKSHRSASGIVSGNRW